MTKMTIPTINIFTENIYEKWDIDQKQLIDNANVYLKYFLSTPEIYENSCLKNQEYDTLVFDILFCDSEKTHTMNREYRNKDYPADIITFAFSECPITFSALASSNFFATASFIFSILSHFASSSLSSYSSFTSG